MPPNWHEKENVFSDQHTVTRQKPFCSKVKDKSFLRNALQILIFSKNTNLSKTINILYTLYCMEDLFVPTQGYSCEKRSKTQYAERILYKIENTFNSTFTG